MEISTVNAEKQIDIKYDDDLLDLLIQASNEDIAPLIDYITDCGKGRVSLSKENCKALINARTQGTYTPLVLRTLIRELQHFGGNSLVNLFRSNGVSYSEIVFDVADHLSVKRSDGESLPDIERNILGKLWKLTVSGTSAADRKALIHSLEKQRNLTGTLEELRAAFNLGPGSISITAASLLSNALAANTLGSGATAGLTAVAGRGGATALGPIGLALSGVWATYSLTAQAYRITMPCVVQIALIRLKQMH